MPLVLQETFRTRVVQVGTDVGHLPCVGVDPQHAFRPTGKAIDPSIRPRHGSQVFVFAVLSVSSRLNDAGSSNLPQRRGVARGDAENRVGVGGDRHNGPIGGFGGTVPFVTTVSVIAVESNDVGGVGGIDANDGRRVVRDSVNGAIGIPHNPTVPFVTAS